MCERYELCEMFFCQGYLSFFMTISSVMVFGWFALQFF